MNLKEEGGAGAAGGSTSAGAGGGFAPANVAAGVKNFDPVMGQLKRRKKLTEEVAARIAEKLKTQ